MRPFTCSILTTHRRQPDSQYPSRNQQRHSQRFCTKQLQFLRSERQCIA